MFQFHLVFNAQQRAFLDDPDSVQSQNWMNSTQDCDCRTGRTSIIAVQLLRMAWQRIGQMVVFEDHSRTRDGGAALAERIRDLAIQFKCEQFVSVGSTYLIVTEPVEFARAMERVITGTV